MAKKTTKKPAKKPARPAPKKPARKPASSKKPKAVGMAAGQRISTGSGPNPEEIGKSLVEMFNKGQFRQIEEKWWSPGVESVEGLGMAWKGRAAVEGKNADWMSQNTIQGAAAEGPYVGATGFAVKFRMDVQDKATSNRTIMEEIGVYTVKNGKIIREEFMYGAAYPATTDKPGTSA
jgi:hypothetical protein